MLANSSLILRLCAAIFVLLIFFHSLAIWAAPFESLYPTNPAILVLINFLVIFLLCASLVIARFALNPSKISSSTNIIDKVFNNRRLHGFLFIVTLMGITLHVWSKYSLIEYRPISNIFEIRFSWLEVDRSLLPLHIRLASVMGHLLTSFAYFGMLVSSYLSSRSKFYSKISNYEIMLLVYFCLVGLTYSYFIGSRNGMLAFLAMNLVGLILGLGVNRVEIKSGHRWSRNIAVFVIPFLITATFSTAIFFERNSGGRQHYLVKDFRAQSVESREGQLDLPIYDKDFMLKLRTESQIVKWRETLFFEICRVCGPILVYTNHGIYNFGKILGSNQRGYPIILKIISNWGSRIGLDLEMQAGSAGRVYGPGGPTLAGGIYHDFGSLGTVLAAVLLGILFGKSILWTQSSGIVALFGVWLFSLLFYVFFISNLFVGIGVLPFIFLLFGNGFGLLVCALISNVTNLKHRRGAYCNPPSSSKMDICNEKNWVEQKDLVSIITPAYCCANVVSETIKSVIAQTYPNWEMLIADDCSADKTRDVIEHWTKLDTRIKLINLERNVGPARARNASLEQAKGRWIAFLDSDDLWLPQKLERCLEFAQATEAAFVYTGFRRISSDGRKLGRFVNIPTSLNYHQLLANTAIATSTVLLDTSRIGPIRMRNTYYDDFDCWLQILKRGVIAYGLNVDLMRYRIMDMSVSRNKLKSAQKVWHAYRNLEGLSIPLSLWYFTQYSVRGVLKYL